MCGGQSHFSQVFLPEENVLCDMMLEFMDMGEKLEQKTSQTCSRRPSCLHPLKDSYLRTCNFLKQKEGYSSHTPDF